ncbi:MAG: hypothetical protein ACRD28_06830 [Acidobacteriaceae bacterium]
MKVYKCGVLGLILLLPAAALGDFQYQETTQITGGSILSMMKFASHFSKQASQANQPIVSAVYVQGNRMARVNPDTIEIIDLDKETITNVDLHKHTYTQMTFEQMRQAMQQGMQAAQASMAQQKAAAPQQQPQVPDNVKLNFKVNVRNTGASKQVSGLNASEAILTMQLEGTDTTTGQQGAFAITSDMWMAADVPGYEEMKEFNRKMAEKMGDLFDSTGMMSQLRAMQPAAGQGMSNLIKESSKLKGIPVEQVVRMGATTNGQPLPAASESPLPQSNGPEMPSATDVAQQQGNDMATSTANNAISNKLSRMGISGFGGFHGFGHKKQQAPPPDNSATTQQAQAPTATVMMEVTTEMSGFSSASISADKFSIPAGYQLVASPLLQQAGK